MTTKIKPEPKEKKELIWTSQEKENHKSEYGCEIIVLVIDKDLETKYKITKEIVSEAYPDITWGGRS